MRLIGRDHPQPDSLPASSYGVRNLSPHPHGFVGPGIARPKLFLAAHEIHPRIEAQEYHPCAFQNLLESTTPRSGNSVRNLMASIVSETRDAVMSSNQVLLHDVGQIYRLLGQHSEQLRELQNTLDSQHGIIKPTVSHSGRSATSSDVPIEQAEEQDMGDQDSCISDIFFECVSRFSTGGLESSMISNNERFLGSPQYAFEQNSSFHPEEYFMSRSSERLVLIAMANNKQEVHTLKCFLLYAATPRRWHRICVYATIKSNSGNEDNGWRIECPDLGSTNTFQLLPKMLQSTLEDLLLDVELFDPVTRVHVSLSEGSSREILYDPRTIRSTEDYEEIDVIDEENDLEELQDIGCVQYRESEVATISRMETYVFAVCVKGQRYMERRAPFAYADDHKENLFKVFFKDLKLLHRLRGCPGIVQFAGAVLDDSGTHLKGYLYEHIPYQLRDVFDTATSRGERIQWPIREEWAKQIISAIAHVHGKGLIIGSLSLYELGLREDETIVVTHLQSSIEYVQDFQNRLPPEVREARRNEDPSTKLRLNFRTDVFQLGRVLW